MASGFGIDEKNQQTTVQAAKKNLHARRLFSLEQKSDRDPTKKKSEEDGEMRQGKGEVKRFSRNFSDSLREKKEVTSAERLLGFKETRKQVQAK